MTEEEREALVIEDLTRLIGFLEHERERPSSCTPDIIDRFDRAIDEHLRDNEEPPIRSYI